jgi:hypothetical protein
MNRTTLLLLIPWLLLACTKSPGGKIDVTVSIDTGFSAQATETGDVPSDTGDIATSDTGQDDTGDTPPSLHVLLANVGNLDEVSDGPCPTAPYYGSTCSVAQEEIMAQSLEDLQPDVVILLEALDADSCTSDTWTGEADLACTDATSREPYQQARRLLGPDYTISCDGRSHRSCIGVRTARITIEQCPAGSLCITGSTTASHPEVCGSHGGFTSVSKVDATWTTDDGPLPASSSFTIIATHAHNATDMAGDACRSAHYKQAFEDLPNDGHTLIAGDMNMDPYRFPELFPSAGYWHTQVGNDKRFTAHSVDADPPTATWLGAATLDYILSDFLSGDCTVLSEDMRIDGEASTMDHSAVSCTLSSPSEF